MAAISDWYKKEKRGAVLVALFHVLRPSHCRSLYEQRQRRSPRQM